MKKKVLALALALVLVLGMTSAFALNACFGNFAWTCNTTKWCGRGTVEIVPYVKVNSCDALGYVWQESTCASAINGENVYFAIKLNVEAYPDKNGNGKTQADYWWDNAKLKFSATGLTVPNQTTGEWDVVTAWDRANKIDWDNDEAESYYWNWKTQEWDEVDDATVNAKTLDNFIIKATVDDASRAKICAKLTSVDDGFGTWEYGDYTVRVYKVTDDEGSMRIENGSSYFSMWWEDGKVIRIESSSKSFENEVEAAFNLSCGTGTCVDADNIKANFGWDTKSESCFNWSTAGTAVVDPTCVVEIPKTGDVSVIAYAVMALVAAAGAMGLKK